MRTTRLKRRICNVHHDGLFACTRRREDNETRKRRRLSFARDKLRRDLLNIINEIYNTIYRAWSANYRIRRRLCRFSNRLCEPCTLERPRMYTDCRRFPSRTRRKRSIPVPNGDSRVAERNPRISRLKAKKPNVANAVDKNRLWSANEFSRIKNPDLVSTDKNATNALCW